MTIGNNYYRTDETIGNVFENVLPCFVFLFSYNLKYVIFLLLHSNRTEYEFYELSAFIILCVTCNVGHVHIARTTYTWQFLYHLHKR